MYFRYTDFINSIRLSSEKTVEVQRALIELMTRDLVLWKEIYEIDPKLATNVKRKCKRILKSIELYLPKGIYPAIVLPPSRYLELLKRREEKPDLYEKNKAMLKSIVESLFNPQVNGIHKKVLLSLLQETLLTYSSPTEIKRLKKAKNCIKTVYRLLNKTQDIVTAEMIEDEIQKIEGQIHNLQELKETLTKILEILENFTIKKNLPEILVDILKSVDSSKLEAILNDQIKEVVAS